MKIKKYLIDYKFVFITGCLICSFFVLCIIRIRAKKKPLFDKIFLINLKRRQDRLKLFMDHYTLSDMKNMPIVKFDAIDGSKLEVDSVPLSELARAELQQLKTTGYRTKHYQLTKGAIGCYLSHVKLWENIIKNNYESVIIFEDDAQVPPDLLHQINANIRYIPTDWDIVLFGYICSKCMKYANYNQVDRFMLTHCYLIKKKAILTILKTNMLFPITQQIDAFMSEMSGILNIYTVRDKIVKQFKSRTDIQAPLISREQQKKLNINVDDRIKIL